MIEVSEQIDIARGRERAGMIEHCIDVEQINERIRVALMDWL